MQNRYLHPSKSPINRLHETSYFISAFPIVGARFLAEGRLESKLDYDTRLYIAGIEIISCYQGLEHARMGLREFRSSKAKELIGLTPESNLSYHIQNHIVRYLGAFDRAIEFANHLYEIRARGIGTTKKVIDALRARNSKLEANLTSFKALVDKTRRERNKMAHLGSYLDEELWIIGGLRSLATTSDPDISDEAKRQGLFYVRKKEVRLQHENSEILSQLCSVLDSAGPEYLKYRANTLGIVD